MAAEVPGHLDQDRAAGEPTGDPAVDAALAGLAEVATAPLPEQVAAYERAAARLHEALDASP